MTSIHKIVRPWRMVSYNDRRERRPPLLLAPSLLRKPPHSLLSNTRPRTRSTVEVSSPSHKCRDPNSKAQPPGQHKCNHPNSKLMSTPSPEDEELQPPSESTRLRNRSCLRARPTCKDRDLKMLKCPAIFQFPREKCQEIRTLGTSGN